MDNIFYHPFNFFCRSLHVKKETLRLHVYVSTFRVIIVSTLIHFLLRSITQWRSFRYTTPWGNSYSLITWLSSRMPPQLFLAGIEVFGKNIVKLAVWSMQWTAHYYVVTFHWYLTDTFASVVSYWKISTSISFCVVDFESSGPSRALLSFEQQNTQLLSEMSPFPYFKITSRSTPW